MILKAKDHQWFPTYNSHIFKIIHLCVLFTEGKKMYKNKL